MKIKAYCLYDKKLQRANLPFYCRGDEEAVLIVVRSQPPRVLYPDLQLKRLFEFDDETCEFFSCLGSVELPSLPAEEK